MWMKDLILWVGWNIFLSLIPVALAYAVAGLAGPSFNRLYASRKMLVILVGLVWIAFLPNACYLLTEWRHFLERLGDTGLTFRWHHDSGAALELMMNTLFYLCYSGIGMLTFALAIRPVARVFKDAGAKLWVWGIPLFMLNSLAVYLGLVLRFNSWEMLTKPSDIWAATTALGARPVLTSFILAFAVFLWIAYWIMDIWVDGFAVRWRNVMERENA
jgi:uncharacterized membrane protein